MVSHPAHRKTSHLASLDGYEKVVELLLKGGAKVDEEDKNGWTALYS
ncbi:ankyrin repeat domain-containing protein [Simkania negevensis]|uniref:Uncharacterized protein n=1 Tax=Simkania negevensis (strain ATCC VR-1471 / DSM 27360 / Z) TaxID=331113 RepID=F8L603_SIMNZ|nr:unknown protein [Simkania negevensis Z]